VLGRAGAKLALCLRLARREHFDWVMGFNFVPHGFNAQLVARRAKTRSLYHMIGGSREWAGGGYSSDNKVLGRLPRPVPWLETGMLRQMSHATVVATMGPHGRNELVARGLSPERVVVIPPSTDPERFRPRESAKPGFDLVVVAALLENKRLSDLVEAVALLGDRHSSLRVGVAGAGPLLGRLQEHAQRLGLAERIEFLGRVNEVEDLYRGATAFVLCSRSEGMPVAMLDAMAAGLPPIVTDVGEIGTLVKDGHNGLLYRVGDVEALARHIDALVSDRSSARRLGVEARASVVAGYSVEAVAAIYRRVLVGEPE
jgi:glycosyltransferase involved in cell wall biosynthesis